jgi:large subunit ribosomal protein L9
MKVILKQDVKGIGKMDEVVNVSPGYARNFLFPRGLAVEADEVQMRELQKRNAVIERKGEKALAEAKVLAERITNAPVTIHAKAGAGSKLYGSITAQDISDAIKAQTKVEVDKRKIHIVEPIKAAGTHTVPVKLHRDVTADLVLEVVTD